MNSLAKNERVTQSMSIKTNLHWNHKASAKMTDEECTLSFYS